MPWCRDSEPEVDDDFENSLCDSKSVCDSESEASWDSEAVVTETDFGLESEGPGSEPIKSGSQSITAFESTRHLKSRSQPDKLVGNVITHVILCRRVYPGDQMMLFTLLRRTISEIQVMEDAAHSVATDHFRN